MVVVIFFIGILTYQIGDEYVLETLDNVTTSIAPGLGISSNMETHIHSLPEEYRALNIPYDLGFVMGFLVFFIASIYSSYKTKESSWLSFFGTITLGFMMFLFMTEYIIVIKDWFILNLIENFLNFELATTPIFYYYVNNMGIINLIWFVTLVIVNKLNFTFARETDENDINIAGGSGQ